MPEKPIRFLKKNKFFLLLILILIVAFFIRVYNPIGQELTYSGFITLQVASQHTFPEFLNSVKMELHPPLYYFLIYLEGKIFDLNELSLRLASIIFSLLSLVLIYFFVKDLFGEKQALLTTFIISILPFHIFYSMIATSYMFFFATLMLNLIALFRFLKKPDWKRAILYSLSSAIMLYTHYFAALFLLMENLFFLIYIKKYRALLKHWITSNILTVVLYLPHIKRFFSDVVFYQFNYFPSFASFSLDPVSIFNNIKTVFSSTFFPFISDQLQFTKITYRFMLPQDLIQTLDFNRYDFKLGFIILAFIFILTFLALLLFDRGLFKEFVKKSHFFVFFAITTLIPLLVCAIFPSFYRTEEFIYAILFFFIVLSYCVLSFKDKYLLLFFVVFMILISILFSPYIYSIRFSPSFKETAAFIKANEKPNDLIFVHASNNLDEFIYYYYNESADPSIYHSSIFTFKDRILFFPYYEPTDNVVINSSNPSPRLIDFDLLRNITANKSVWFIMIDRQACYDFNNLMNFFNENYNHSFFRPSPEAGEPFGISFFSNEREVP